MTDLRVLIDGTEAGTLSRGDGHRLRFEYDEPYAKSPASTPLSLSMPLDVRVHTHAALEPWLAGLLPDNPDVLRRWAREFAVGNTEPFSLLATPIGEDCAGGVQFVRAGRLGALLAEPGSVEWLTEHDLAERIREMVRDDTAWQARTARAGRFTGQFSLAGRQTKTALLLEDGRWGIPSGRIPTTHIVKPPIRGLRDQDLVEHLCLDAARMSGLPAAESRILAIEDVSAIVVTRYDRRRGPGGFRRIHQEDLCQALGVSPDRKYQTERGPGPVEIVALLRRVLPAARAEAQVGRFVDALVFNWIIAGTDAHAKNYSLLLNRSEIALAPLYDITSVLPFENERHMRLAMKIADDYTLYNYRNPWPIAAANLGLDAAELNERVATLCATVPAAFTAAAGRSAIADLGRPTPRRLADLVTRRAARCATLLSKPPRPRN
jgi:serine/threonine-protein kinase HipA